jgi:protein-tyrosine phosphatase
MAQLLKYTGELIKSTMYSSYSKITNNIFLGNVLSAVDSNFIISNGIKVILSLSTSNINIHPNILSYHHYYIQDDPKQDIITIFNECTAIIENAIKKGYKILVHCEQGVSRSASVVIAYLMRYMNMNLVKAYNFVKQRRIIIQPNSGFIMQLKLYEVLGCKKVND